MGAQGERKRLPSLTRESPSFLSPSLSSHTVSRQASEADRGDGIFFLDGADSPATVAAAAAAGLLSAPQQQLWALQRYVARPLLLRKKKFHLRVMVLAVGDLAVYFHRNAVVALFASDDFSPGDFSDKCACECMRGCVGAGEPQRKGIANLEPHSSVVSAGLTERRTAAALMAPPTGAGSRMRRTIA